MNIREITMDISNQLKRSVWEKGQIVDGLNPDMYRKDPCGALIVWDKYGMQDNMYGWEIDHIFPKSKLEDMGISASLIDDLRNLRPMQHENNASKNVDYPSYVAVVTANGNKNYHKEVSLTVNEETRAILAQLYNL